MRPARSPPNLNRVTRRRSSERRRTSMTTLSNPSLSADLAEHVSGAVLTPGAAGYDEARAVHNGLIDRKPALIVRCRTTADVVAALAYARDTGLEVSVRGGGHNVAGRAVT